MKKILSAVAAASAALAFGATDATWTGSVDQVDNGSWTTVSNWSSSPALPGGAGSVITFPAASEGSQLASTTLDDAFTVGTFKVDGSSKNWTFKPGAGGSLTFDKGDGTMPELNVTAGNRGITFNAPLKGSNGLLISGSLSSRVIFTGANTYTGDTVVMGSALTIASNDAVGNTSRYFVTNALANTDVYLRVNPGVTFDKNIVLFGSPAGGKNKGAHLGFEGAGSASGQPDTVINGNIYCASPAGSAQIFVNAYAPFLAAINGDILEYDSNIPSNIGLRHDNNYDGTCVVNGRINLPNGTLTKNGAGTWILTNIDNVWKTTVMYAGVLKMGAAGAYPEGVPLQFTEYGTGATFDLNGFDQTTGPLPNKSGSSTGNNSYIRTDSDKPCVLTMSVTDANNNTSKGPVVFQGPITLRKTGSGTQELSANTTANGTRTDELAGGIEVKEGTLVLNNELNTAKITVDGGTLNGTTTLKYTATSPETFTFKSGTCDVSNMTITFSAGEVPYGSHLVFDASEATAANLTAASGEYWPFAGVDGDLPKGCRWRYNATQRKAYLVHPQSGLFICVR